MSNSTLYKLNPYIIAKRLLSSYIIIDIQSNKYHIINKSLFSFIQYLEHTKGQIAHIDLLPIIGESVTKFLLSQNILIESSVGPNDEIVIENPIVLPIKESNGDSCIKINFMDTHVAVFSYNSVFLKKICDIYQSFITSKNDSKSKINIFILKSRKELQSHLICEQWVHTYTIFDIKMYDDLNHNYKYIESDNFSCFYDNDFTDIYITADNDQICVEITKILIDLSLEANLMKKDWIALHGAAIQDEQHHIILIGTSGIGKSTLSLLVCQSEANYELVSDERYYLNIESKKRMGYCYGLSFSPFVKNNGIEAKTIDRSCNINMNISDLENKERILIFMDKKYDAPVLTELTEGQIVKAIIKAVLDSNHNFGMIIRSKEYYIKLITAYEQCLDNARCYQLNSSYDEDRCLRAILAVTHHNVPDNCSQDVIDVLEPVNKNNLLNYNVAKNHNEILLCINQFVLKLIGESSLIEQIANEYNSYIVEGPTSIYTIATLECDANQILNNVVRWQSDQLDLQFSETIDSWFYYFNKKCLIQYDKAITKAMIMYTESDNGYAYVRSIIGYVIQMLSIKRDDICLHAALLRDQNGEGIILLGPKGSGKTTICYWLLESRYSILSDETAILRADGENYYALGIRRNLTLREDVSKHYIGKGQQLYFPFSREKKTVVKLENDMSVNQWIKVTDIYKMSAHKNNCFEICDMSSSDLNKEIFTSGLLDLPNIDYLKLQNFAFDIINKVQGHWCFVNKDIKDMEIKIKSQFRK